MYKQCRQEVTSSFLFSFSFLSFCFFFLLPSSFFLLSLFILFLLHFLLFLLFLLSSFFLPHISNTAINSIPSSPRFQTRIRISHVDYYSQTLNHQPWIPTPNQSSSSKTALSHTPSRLKDRLLNRSSDSFELLHLPKQSEHHMKRCLTWWDLIWLGFGIFSSIPGSSEPQRRHLRRRKGSASGLNSAEAWWHRSLKLVVSMTVEGPPPQEESRAKASSAWKKEQSTRCGSESDRRGEVRWRRNSRLEEETE